MIKKEEGVPFQNSQNLKLNSLIINVVIFLLTVILDNSVFIDKNLKVILLK